MSKSLKRNRSIDRDVSMDVWGLKAAQMSAQERLVAYLAALTERARRGELVLLDYEETEGPLH